MARLNLCFILVMSLVYCTLAEEKYTNKYDNFNIDQVLNNDRILTNYVKCLMEEGSCTNEGRELKKTLPDALQTDCKKCNELQKERANKVLNFMKKNRVKDFNRLSAKYDPNNEYTKRFEANGGKY